MNKRVEIWKRKIEKEKRRQQKLMWDRLKDTTPPKRMLSAQWKIEDGEMSSMFGLDVEKELADILAKEIDAEILKSLLGENK